MFKTTNKANSVLKSLEDAIALQRGDGGNIVLTAWDDALAKNKVKFRNSKGNGDFRVHAYPDMAILISTYDPEDELTIEDARFQVITLAEGQTEYEHAFKSTMDKGSQRIENVDVFGVNKDTINIVAAPPIDDGKNMYFRIHVDLPKAYGNSKARLVIQPMSVDCQTEDTVDYIPGVVMEGYEYHKLQDKRMRFNYMKYDNVAYCYSPKLLYDDEKIYVDTTLVYVKPNRRKTYKIPYEVVLAEFNNDYFHQSASTGSCNGKNIFKFIDLGVAAADMDVDEFQVTAESNYDTKNQDLRLRFIVGKSELINDSINEKMLNDLVTELRSYGDQLMEVKVEASASPEGGLESNRRLAAERTKVAVQKVRNYMGKVDVAFHTGAPKVYTWEDVAKQVEEDGFPGHAEQIRKNMGMNGYGGDAAIQAIEGYETVIEPVLVTQRRMRVTYRYEREHIMDADEAYAAYLERKHDLLQGKGKDFSDGDYYNLYTVIKDSAELDTLTMIAYNHVTRTAGYENIKFSMYVANKMAMLNSRQGKPDARVLAPFINSRLRAMSVRERSEKAQKNRREVLINQIITYFQMEERDSALSYCNYWFANDNDPKVERLKKYIKFKEGFVKYATHQLSPAEEKEVLDAMNFVISCSPDNKAVIYTEAREILNVPNSVCQELVAAMDDENPKKWYLRGILEADLEEQRLGEPKKPGYIPKYLCFFDHSFELEPSFKWLYLADGQVSDKLREKFKYSKKQKERYRDMFNNSVTLKNEATADGANDVMEISGDEDEVDESTENGENPVGEGEASTENSESTE
ncbi:MAG: hypothetical protein K6A78_01500 [Prevotella sp.]|nr:hypothetical protein [Prevotella sp.]